MKKNIAAGQTKIILVPVAQRTSVAITPNGSTYTLSYSLTPGPKLSTKNWIAIPDMTAVTEAKTKEFGPISALRIAVTGGSGVVFESVQAP